MNKLLEQLLKAEAKAKDVIEKEGSTSEEIKAITTEIQTIKAKIEAQKILDVMENERIEAQSAADLAAAKPVNTPLYAEPKNHTKAIWKNNGEFLKAVYNAAQPGKSPDQRLFVTNAASGMGESVPSDGGFLVGADFAT